MEMFGAVLRVDVPTQIDLPLKGAQTLMALKRFEARMFSAVCNQIRRLRKSLATNNAFVRFLS